MIIGWTYMKEDWWDQDESEGLHIYGSVDEAREAAITAANTTGAKTYLAKISAVEVHKPEQYASPELSS